MPSLPTDWELEALSPADAAVAAATSLLGAQVERARFDADPQVQRALDEHAEFLLHLAFLPRISAYSAAEISGRCDAPVLLDSLCASLPSFAREAAHAPVYAMEEQLRRYLLGLAAERFTEQKMQDLRQLALKLLKQDGMAEDLFELYVANQQWYEAIHIVRRLAGPLVKAGKQAVVTGMLSRIPLERRRDDAACHYWLGMCTPSASAAARLESFERAWALYQAADEPEGMTLCLSELVMQLYGSFAVGPTLRRWLDHLYALLRERGGRIGEGARLVGYCAAMQCGLINDVGRRELRVAAQLGRLLARSPVSDSTLPAAAALLKFLSHHGLFVRARRLLAQYAPAIDELAAPALAKAGWHANCARHYYTVFEHDAMNEALAQTELCAHEAGVQAFDSGILLIRLYSCLASPDITAAAAYFAKLEAILSPDSAVEYCMFNEARAWYALRQQQPREALIYAQMAHRQAREMMVPTLEAYAELALTVTLTADRQFAKAQDLFDKLRLRTAFCRSDFVASHVRLLAARLDHERGDKVGSLEKLRSAFLIARESHAFSTLFWLPDVMTDICAKALRHDIEVDYVRSLIATHGLVPYGQSKVEAWPWPVRLYTLGSFSIFRNDAQIRFSGKAQRKPLDFLKVLIALGGTGVDIVILTHLLWPDAEGDAAQRSFHSTLHRLRKLIGYEDAVTLTDRKVSLNTELCWVDVWEFERLVDGHASRTGAVPPTLAAESPEMGEVVNRVLALYCADFLASDEMQAWILPMRDKLRSKFLRFVAAVGDELETGENSASAISLYLRGLESDPLAEEFYRRLIACRFRRGEHGEALAIYRRCRDVLSIILGICPSEKTNALYRQIMAQS